MAKKDKVKPLKIENSVDGTETDFLPTELDTDEDYISLKGIAFENSDNQLIHITDDEITFEDTINSVVKLSSIINSGDTILRNNYQTFTYTLGKLTNHIYWTSVGQTQKIKEYNYTYVLGRLNTTELKIYDTNGSLLLTYTETYTYSGINVVNITGVVT